MITTQQARGLEELLNRVTHSHVEFKVASNPPWFCVKLDGQEFAIWNSTGWVYAMHHGEVADDPMLKP